MADGSHIELAKAYVTIVPSMQGAQSSIAEQFADVEATAELTGSSAGISFGSGFAGALATAGSVAASIGTAIASGLAEGATALANFTAQGGVYADQIATMSTNTHLSTDELQAYTYAAQLTDVSVETLTSSMARNIRSMNSAASGTSSIADAYASLGVSVTDADGNLRDSQTVYWELIDALQGVDDYTQRDALSMQIFGRSAQDLNSLIAVGSEGMQEYAQMAQDAGAILDSDTIDAFHAFDDVNHQLTQGVDAAKNALGTILLPILTEMGSSGVDLLGQFTNGILNANGDIGQMGEVVNQIAPQLETMLQTYLPSLVEIATTLISTLASALISNLPIVLSGAGRILRAIGQGIIDVLPELAPIAADLIVGLVEFIITNLPTVIDAAIQIIVAVVNGISIALPRLIPAAIDAVTQVATALIDNIDLILPAAIELCLAIGMGMIAAIPDMIAMLPQIGDSIRNELGEIGPSLAEAALTWGADLIQSFVDGISNSIGRVRDAVSNVADEVRSFLGFSEPEKGPLSNFHTYAPDMIDLFNEGLEESSPELEATLNRTLSAPDLGNFDTVSSFPNYEPSADEGGNIVIPVNIGQERLDTIMIRSSQISTYRRGG